MTGTPPAFCVGADSEALAGHAERGGYDDGLPAELATPGYGVRPEFDHDFSFHFGLPFVLVAAVNGAAPGVGLAVALFCDLRFVSATAKLTTAAPRLGLPAEYGMSWMLPRLDRRHPRQRPAPVRPCRHRRRDTPTGACGTASSPTARRRSPRRGATPPSSPRPSARPPLRTTKRQIYDDLLRHDVGAALADARRLLVEAMSTAEYREGVAAFSERRPPKF